jgi:hypothetical protein
LNSRSVPSAYACYHNRRNRSAGRLSPFIVALLSLQISLQRKVADVAKQCCLKNKVAERRLKKFLDNFSENDYNG